MKRQRVRLRPKAKTARRGAAARAAAVVAAAGMAAVLASAKPWRRVSVHAPGWGPLARAMAVETLEFDGVPGEAADAARRALGFVPGEVWGPLEADRRAGRLREAFPWLDQAAVTRSWTRRAVRFWLVPKTAVASASGGRPSGALLLGEDGALFAPAPGTAAPAGVPSVDLTGWPAGGALGGLARLVRAAGAEGALPSKPSSYGYDVKSRSWAVTLEDGTRLAWGDLEWTDEKLARLREVLADAGGRMPKGFTVDLTYFEDGRILARP